MGPASQLHQSQGRQSRPAESVVDRQGIKQEHPPSAEPQAANLSCGAQQQQLQQQRQQLRHNELQQQAAHDQQPAALNVVGPADEEGLAEFSRMLSVFTHCAKLKVIAQLPRTSNAHCSNILSSIEFDRDSQVDHTSFDHVMSWCCMYPCNEVVSCSHCLQVQCSTPFVKPLEEYCNSRLVHCNAAVEIHLAAHLSALKI